MSKNINQKTLSVLTFCVKKILCVTFCDTAKNQCFVYYHDCFKSLLHHIKTGDIMQSLTEVH